MFNDWRQPFGLQQPAGPAQAGGGGFVFPEVAYDEDETHQETLRHLEELYNSSSGEERQQIRKQFREQALFKGDMTEDEFDAQFPDEAQEQQPVIDWQALFRMFTGWNPAQGALDEMEAIGTPPDHAGDALERMNNIGRLPVHPLILLSALRRDY
jgi:hypothetical protein